MPNLVKVGYSMKDPELRARDFDHTGAPHPFAVDYEVLVDEPYPIEQRVHRELSAKREGREWYRCTAEEAIAAITFVTEGKRHVETFKGANREEANQLVEERRREEDLRRKEATRVAEERKHAEELERAIADRVAQATTRVRLEYDRDVARQFPEIEFWPYWLGWGFGFLISFYIVFDPIKNDVGAWIAATIAGAIAAFIHISKATEKRKKSPAYLALIQRRDATIENIARGPSQGDVAKSPQSNKQLNGQGTQTYPDGGKYVGEFKDGKRHGQGTYTWSNGEEYVGEWRDGTRNGQGAMTWPSGEKNVGEFKDSKLNGQGTGTLPDGTKYVGEYKESELNGHGTLVFPNGAKYVGEFKDSMYNGQGAIYGADGTILESGIWENGVFVTAR